MRHVVGVVVLLFFLVLVVFGAIMWSESYIQDMQYQYRVSETQRLEIFLRELQIAFPIPDHDFPIWLGRDEIEEDGYVTWESGEDFKSHAHIMLHIDITGERANEILLHEYAHIMAGECHDDAWGIAYAKLIRHFYEDCEEPE